MMKIINSRTKAIFLKLVNKGYITKTDFLISVFFKKLVIVKYLKLLYNYNSDIISGNNSELITVTYDIKPYTGNNKIIIEIYEYLIENISSYLNVFIINGSNANNEEINFSDLDLLIILKDSVFNDKKSLKKVIYSLNKCLSKIYRFDFLQHHGFFIIFESELSDYPCGYFPDEIFSHCRQLGNNNLTIRKRLSVDYNSNLKKLTNTIILSLNTIYRNRFNSFILKDFISRLLLIPSLYLSIIYGKGIYKKDSFELILNHISDENNETIRMISNLRLLWNAGLKNYAKFFSYSSNPFLRVIFIRFNSCFVKNTVCTLLTEELIFRIRKFIKEIDRKY